MQPELLFGLGALILLAGIIYGVTRNQTRNRANDQIRDQATKEIYRDPEGVTPGADARLDKIEDRVKPS